MSIDPQPVNHFLDPSQRLVYEARPADMMLWAKQYTFGNTAPFNSELETYLPQNVFVGSDGTLTLEGRNTGGGDPSIANGKYTSGMAASWNCFSFTYGYLEASIKFCAGYGVWPAFWLLYSTVQAINEIDVCEIFEAATSLNCGVHFPAGATHDGGPYVVPDMTQGYHAYAVDWQPGYIAFYFDGQPLFRSEIPSEIPSALMYVLLNVAISGVAVNNHVPADSQFPLDMSVRYVRLWQGTSSQYQLVRGITPNYGSYGTAVVLDGASAYYPLSDASARDLIAGNNGTIVGGVSLAQPALTSDGSKSMLFDGASGYVSVPSAVNPAGLYAFSAELWFEFQQSAYHGGRLLSNAHTDQSNTGFQLVANTGGGGLASLTTANKTSNLYWGNAISVNTPHHYVLTYDGAHIYAYLDGAQIGNDTLTGAIVASSYNVNIGRGAYGNDYSQALISQVGIYPLALSATQVTAHYNAGRALFPKPVTVALSSNITTQANIDDLVVCSAAFTSSGTPVDPGTVRALVKAPDSSVQVYAYGTDNNLYKDGLGAYHLNVYANQAGTWTYRFEGLGSYAGAAEATFTVRSSAF